MARSSTGRVLLVVCLLFLATGTVAATPIAPASDPAAIHDSPVVETLGTPIDDATNTTDNTTDDTTNTTGDTTDDTTDDTTNTTETTETTTETTTTETTTTETTETTTTTVENTTESTTETTETTTTNTTENTTETTETTTDNTTSTVENTTDDTTNTTETSTSTTAETTENTTESLTETTNSTPDTVDSSTESVQNATDSVETGVSLDSSTSVDTVAGGASIDATLEGDATLDSSDTLSGTTDTIDETTDTLDETTGSIDETTESVDEGVSTVVDSPDDAVHTASDGSGDDTLHAAGSGSGSSTTEASSDERTGGGSVESETEVNVEDTGGAGGGSDDDQIAGLLASAYRGLGGMIPASVPGGPAGGAVGLGGLALAAVVSRQWLSQAAGTGAPSLLTSGFEGRVDGWVEKLKRFVVPLRYSRYDDSDPLEHETRRALYEAIDASPGVYLTDLAEQAAVPVSTARHHVRVLSDERLVRTEKRHGKRRYYPATATDTELTDALSEPAKAAVLHALAEHGESHVGLLADELDRDPSTITHHLQALAEDDLVERERQGRSVVNRLADDVESILTGGEMSPEPADRVSAPADD